MDIKIKCKRCKKQFDVSESEYAYLKRKSQELKSEFILPKLCNDCRIIKEQVKSIPMKIQTICNLLVEQKEFNVEDSKRQIMLIFGLARKQMKENLINFGFIDKEQVKE